MFRRFSVNFAVISIFLDAVLAGLALLIAVVLRAPLSFLPFLQKVDPVMLPWILYLVFPAMWVGVLLLFNVYDGRKNLRVLDELSNFTLGSLLATVSMAGLLYLSFRDVSRFLFISAAALTFLLLISWRIAARLVFRKHGLHSQARRVLIIGAGETGCKLAQQIRSQPAVGLSLVGFLNDNGHLSADPAEILGPSSLARQIVLEHAIDDVIFALPADAHERITSIVCELNDLSVHIWVIPDFFAVALHRARADEFGGIPMLDLRAPALDDYQRMSKRAFDIAATLLMMPFVLPVMALVALLVRLDSPGPILYRTRRIGENGSVFVMYKFRTMVANADQWMQQVLQPDESGRVIHKKRNDPRITRVGRFLRKTSLDELPQLLNVLIGDMSLVGPRPEIPELVERYTPWQRERFAVPQGMTGWWQVNGRSNKPLHLNTEDDLYYVRNYSVWLDLRILVKTVWVVISGKGAF
jgi:exopolysaccharide biosynthesis polyprenyl glycosylphosphotransferase